MKLTHDVEWSTLAAYNIVVGIESIKSMMITNIWIIFLIIIIRLISQWILNNIKYQLNGEELFQLFCQKSLKKLEKIVLGDDHSQRVEVFITVKYKIPRLIQQLSHMQYHIQKFTTMK